MAFQPVPDCAEIIVKMSVAGKTIINTFYAAIPGGYTVGNIQDLADEVDIWVTVEYLPILSSSLGYLETIVTGLANQNDWQRSADAGAGVGGVASPPTANSLAYAVKRNSSVTGRSARGRVFLPLAQSQLQSNENLVTTAYRDAAVDALNAIRTYIAAAGWLEVIVSRFSGGEKRGNGIYFQVVSYSASNLTVDNQRGRKPDDA